MLGPFLDAEASICVAGQVSKALAGVGHLKRICKHVFRAAGTVQETHESDMLGGPGADFLRRVAFWSITSSGLLR